MTAAAGVSRASEDESGVLPPCDRGAHSFARFRVEGDDGAPVHLCLRHTLSSRRVVRTALTVAAVVGTVLTAINQGDQLASGNLQAAMLWKTPLTYCVPYCVATVSALRVAQLRRHGLPRR
ncbi:hypothetical protein HRbin29_00696 [bacterium HR29]|nr:hypothetical protein HRbin29_00696 [bacterium HR29]